MAIGDPHDWMWGDALEMLARAIHPQAFNVPSTAGDTRGKQ